MSDNHRDSAGRWSKVIPILRTALRTEQHLTANRTTPTTPAEPTAAYATMVAEDRHLYLLTAGAPVMVRQRISI
jgi:hypothetical protein